jgi:hypothetical protein
LNLDYLDAWELTMLIIRCCKACGSRIRMTPRAADRTGPCPYCKAKQPIGTEDHGEIAPTRAERIIWALGLLTEAAGGVLFVVVLFGHERFSMSWLGAGLVGLILSFLFVIMGRTARIGSPYEVIVLDVIVLVLLYVLVFYGAFAFKPLDALGGSAMVALAAFCILEAGSFAVEVSPSKARAGWAAGWLMLLLFLTSYAYHAFASWLGR